MPQLKPSKWTFFYIFSLMMMFSMIIKINYIIKFNIKKNNIMKNLYIILKWKL